LTHHLLNSAFAAVVWAAMLPAAFAQDAHRKAAQALHEVLAAADSTTAVQLVASAMGSQDPMLRKHKDVVARWLTEQIGSQAYAEAKIASYMDVYTEEELNLILALVKTPAFRLFQAKHQQTLRSSAPKLVQLARENEPELERRLQQAERNTK
jgi:sugar (pentulose or hexulose) kinase